ncbi:hypothetical protein NPHGCBPM_00260 [Klebsiella phage 150031]|nr:hypothetical protein NPHGCBPM_00260 [Klebsiella phage 150031]
MVHRADTCECASSFAQESHEGRSQLDHLHTGHIVGAIGHLVLGHFHQTSALNEQLQQLGPHVHLLVGLPAGPVVSTKHPLGNHIGLYDLHESLLVHVAYTLVQLVRYVLLEVGGFLLTDTTEAGLILKSLA